MVLKRAQAFFLSSWKFSCRQAFVGFPCSACAVGPAFPVAGAIRCRPRRKPSFGKNYHWIRFIRRRPKRIRRVSETVKFLAPPFSATVLGLSWPEPEVINSIRFVAIHWTFFAEIHLRTNHVFGL